MHVGKIYPVQVMGAAEGVDCLSDSDLELLRIGDDLIAWIMETAILLHWTDGLFSVENPWPGWLWVIGATLALWKVRGVIGSCRRLVMRLATTS